VSNVAGHAYRIPARKCFEDVMRGTFGDTTAKAFNANNCYTSSGGGASVAAPTNLVNTMR
jgi:dTDP-4-amino-4,6-dideoxygalactose transaminase